MFGILKRFLGDNNDKEVKRLRQIVEKINSYEEVPEVCPKCGSKHLEQDKDVLDTWFSSALWPFSTLGWPEKTEGRHSGFRAGCVPGSRGGMQEAGCGY